MEDNVIVFGLIALWIFGRGLIATLLDAKRFLVLPAVRASVAAWKFLVARIARYVSVCLVRGFGSRATRRFYGAVANTVSTWRKPVFTVSKKSAVLGAVTPVYLIPLPVQPEVNATVWVLAGMVILFYVIMPILNSLSEWCSRLDQLQETVGWDAVVVFYHPARDSIRPPTLVWSKEEATAPAATASRRKTGT